MTLRQSVTIVLLAVLLVSSVYVYGSPALGTENEIASQDLTINSDIIENRGQLKDDTIEFYTFGQFRAALGNDFIRYSLERKNDDDKLRMDCWQVNLIGSRKVDPEGIDPTNTAYNFFYEGEQFIDVNGYKKVLYEDLYPNIDMIYHSSGQDLKYDLILKPGSDPNNIMLGVSGHNSLSIVNNELIIELQDGTRILERGLDVFYQDTKESITAEFTLIDENTFSFSLDEYDATRTVVIDPVVFSTWVGGLGGDNAYGMEVDSNGNTYVTGTTTAREFPVTVGAYETEWKGSQDTYLFKMNNTGKGIIFCTLIGGSSDEAGMVIHLDDIGNIYLTGRVSSDDFPTSNNAFSRTHSGLYDVFVCKFNPTASSLLFSTYVGGVSSEWPQNIVVDDMYNVFVGGIINGEGFPTSTDPIGETYGGGDIDGFLFKMNPQGSQLVYSTYIGGDQDDRVTGLVLDDEGYAYITGYTRSTDFTLTNGAYDTTPEGSSDAYIMKVNHDGKTPIYSTLFGGDAGDGIYDLAMDEDGDLVFTGLTYSTDLPTTSSVVSTTHIGDADIFLTEMDINCTTVKRCTYIGSSEYEKPLFINIGPAGRITLTGTTSSSSFPVTSDAILSSLGDFSDPFLLTVLADWSDIQYATYLGGGRIDQIAGAGTDDKGRIYAAGSTDNENFPTTNGSFEEVNNGFEDAYVLSISLDTPPTPPRDLTAVSGDNYVNLTWNTPTNPGSLDLIGYDIYRGETVAIKTLLTTLGNVLHYNDTDVENGKTYFYHVRAKNTALDSIPTPEVQATPFGVPGNPQNLQALGGYMKVDLSWKIPLYDGGTEILGYNLYRTDELIEVITPIGPLATKFTDEAVEAGTNYEYAISALNLIGESQISEPITATPVSEPSSPMNLTLRSGDGFVEISWIKPELDGGLLIREYNVYRGTSGEEPTLLKNMGANVKKYNDSTVHNGLQYAYYVVAVNVIGESLPTETLETTPMTLPSIPLNFQANAGNEKVELLWEEPINDGGSPITGYQIRKIRGEEEPEFIDIIDLFYIDTEVENGVSYSYSMASINSVGLSFWINEVHVVPATTPDPLTINLLSLSEGHIHVGWEQPGSNGGMKILSFELYRGEDDSTMSLYKTFGPEMFQFNDTNVMMGVELYYGISAVNTVGSSEILEMVVAAPVGIPTSPENVSFELHDLEVWISWSEPISDGGEMISGYTIFRTEILSGTITTSDVGGDQPLYKDMMVTPGITYEYHIKARNNMGHGLPSDIIEVTAYRAPSQIVGLEVRSNNGMVELTWSALDLTETGEVSIEVQRNIGLGEFNTVAVLEGTATSFQDENIRDGVIYTYKVIARNDAGSSESSEMDIDLTESSSSSLSAGSIIIMLIGTLIPLIVAGIFIFMLMKSRKGNEPVKEEAPIEETIQSEVTGAAMDNLPPMSTQEVTPPQMVQEQLPPQQIPPEPEPVIQDQPVPIQEEVPMQEEPNPFLDQTVEETLPPEVETTPEVIQ